MTLIVPNPCFRLMITECVCHRFGMRDMQWGLIIPTPASMPRGGSDQVAVRPRRGENKTIINRSERQGMSQGVKNKKDYEELSKNIHCVRRYRTGLYGFVQGLRHIHNTNELRRGLAPHRECSCCQ